MLKNNYKSKSKSKSRTPTTATTTTTSPTTQSTRNKKIRRSKEYINSISYSDEESISIENDDSNTNSEQEDSKNELSNNLKHDSNIEGLSRTSKTKISLDTLLEQSAKKKNKKTKKHTKLKQFSLSITPISTSVLKFNKRIRRPQIQISIYDASSGKDLRKQLTEKVENNSNPKIQHEKCYITEPGEIASSKRFSFEWNSINSTITIGKETNYMQNCNIIIFLELIDNSNAKSIDKWYNIAWCYYKPIDSDTLHNHKNDIIPLQLYCYKKSSKSADSVYDEWTKRKRKEYPGVLNTQFNCEQYDVQNSKNVSRKNSLQVTLKDITNKLSTEQPPSLTLNDEQNTTFLNSSLDLKRISKINESTGFKLPEKIIFKSNKLDNTNKGSCSNAFNVQYNLLAYSLLNHRRSVDIIILDLLDMKCRYILKGHEGFIHYIEWSNRKFDKIGEILLSCSEDQTCIIWQILESSYEILNVLFHPTFVYCGTYLIEDFTKLGGIVTGSRDNIIRIWKNDNKSNNLVLFHELNQHKHYIIGIIYVFKSNKLFTADKSGIVIEWKFNNTKCKWSLRKIIPYNSYLKQFLFQSSLNRIYILSEDFISTYEVRSSVQQICLNFACAKDSPYRIAISKCGQYIFIAFKIKIICWDIKSKTIFKEYYFNQGNINWISFNSEHNILAISVLSNCTGGCYLYSTLDYFTIENVTKKFIESKDPQRFGMSINNYYNYILQKLDEIFNLDNKFEEKVNEDKIKKSSLDIKNKDKTIQREIKENNLYEKNYNDNDNNINDRTFNIEKENSDKTFTLTKKTGTYNVVTVKENKLIKTTKDLKTFTLEQPYDENIDPDDTDVSESLESECVEDKQ